MSRRRVVALFSACLIIGASTLAAAAPAAAKSHLDVLLDGLSSPKGITMLPGKSVGIGQGAYGPPGPALQYFLTGPQRGTAQAVTDPANLVDIAVTPDGAGWAIGGDAVLYRQTPDGVISPILDIAAYQAADPDPVNSAGDPAETNPFGLAALASNDVLIADAAGNDLIRVSPNGTARTVTRWARMDVGGASAEAVPTSIAIGRDGWAYVGQLVGFPGTPGSAHIWRVNPNAVGALCAVGGQGNCSDWKSGFTSIMDLAFNPNNGTLYVYEIAKDGWVAFEAGFEPGGVFPPAVLLEVKGKRTRELAKGELSQPGGVAVGRDGQIYVTDGMFGNGRLLRVRGD
jgi:hypothetical protein